jgi:hypothetical protein
VRLDEWLRTALMLRPPGKYTTTGMGSPNRLGCRPACPLGLNEETYLGKIQPLLAALTNKAVASALGSSIPYASAIRAGRRVPHPRHWQALAELVGVSDV